MTKVVITGGAGFIGSHLSSKLIEDGYEIFCLDNFYTGNINNIQKLINNPRFHLINQNVENSLDFEAEQIYNLACPASPFHYQKNPVQTIRTSVLGALNVLELAKQNSAKVLQASTSEVYGDPEVHPQPEGYWGRVNPIGVRSCYDEGKRCAETLFFDFHRQHGIQIKIARIFNTYEPNLHPDDGIVINNFIIQALLSKNITTYGTGLQTRSFYFVSDLVDGLVSLINSDSEVTGAINLGNPIEHTMIELADAIIELCGSQSQKISLDLPQDDPKKRKPDISRAQKLLGWNPIVGLEEGLKRTIKYFRSISNQKTNENIDHFF